MSFSDAFLDELRAAVRVSEIVGRKFKLRKSGAEFQAVEDKSIKCNDGKRLWWDFGKGQDGGDVFEFLVAHEGLTFPQAVDEVARIAGIAVPGREAKPTKKNGAAGAPHSRTESHPGQAGRGSKREITKTYDYRDADGALLYQVVRLEWTDERGAKQKSFGQRRPAPGAPADIWVWGLDFVGEDGSPLEFMRKGPGKDWARFNAANFEAWHYTERRIFPDAGNVPHSLYRLPELRAELAEERQDQRTAFLCEGEKDCETLVAWEAVATTNSGGAKHFTEAQAKHFEDAADVVICEDNDEAGAQRTERIAPMLLAVGARVRVLRIAEHWPTIAKDCPGQAKGHDVTDWRDRGGGTAVKLFEIIDRLKDWAPAPYRSKFGLRLWSEQGAGEKVEYKWAIKGIVPYRQNVLIIGPSGSGKSFEAQEMAMHVARGADFAGRKTMRLGVVYCCYEMPASMEKRVIAYRQWHGLPVDDSIPFAWLTRPPGLFASEENAESLAEDIVKATARWTIPLGVIVVDTNNAATRGSSEVKSEDIGKIIDRYALIAERTGAGLWIVGHTNVDGEHRGNQQLYNGIETCLLVQKEMDGTGAKAAVRRDDLNRTLRKVTVKKQREGEDGLTWRFVLQQVEIGKDEDGDPITSMVSADPQLAALGGELRDRRAERHQAGASGAWHLSKGEASFFKALLASLGSHGVKPPVVLGLPSSVALVVSWHDLAAAYRNVVPIDDDVPSEDGGMQKYLNRTKQAMHRDRESLKLRNVIGVGQVTDRGQVTHYLWPVGRPVVGPGIVWPERLQGSQTSMQAANTDAGDESQNQGIEGVF